MFEGERQDIRTLDEAAVIARQEVVSMLPVRALAAKREHKVFDACAAPGSKTTQILEDCLVGVWGKDLVKNEGFLVANDEDFSRANMLAHQVARFNYGWIGKKILLDRV